MTTPATDRPKRVVASVYSVTLPDGSEKLVRSFLVHQQVAYAALLKGPALVTIWPSPDRNALGQTASGNVLKAIRVRTEP